MTFPLTVPLTITEHFPAVSAQEDLENVIFPDPETFVQVIVPVRKVAEPLTMAVQVVDEPIANVGLVHNIAVLVGARVTISTKEAEVGKISLSPW